MLKLPKQRTNSANIEGGNGAVSGGAFQLAGFRRSELDVDCRRRDRRVHFFRLADSRTQLTKAIAGHPGFLACVASR